jgi:hypothetical protein
MNLSQSQMTFLQSAITEFGENAIVTRQQLKEFCERNNVTFPAWIRKAHSIDRGKYKLPSTTQSTKVEPVTVDMAQPALASVTVLRQPKLQDESDSAIPEAYPDYVPFGFFKDLRNIIKSQDFYPVFVTGLSGNGKTLMVEQVCAELKRECIRVNISIETDESDLLGGPTLINGNVVNRDGPVLQAMKRGAVLLIDEVDRGSNKLMCLQGILEGKPYYNKKSGELVHPKNGFTVVATANTKGRGSEEGRYLSQVLDDAFLERFPITVEQEYPDAKTERKILAPLINDTEFVEHLVTWADVIRKTFDEGGIDEIISTRRLVHIAKAYKIFGNRMKAIELCVNRFDTETKNAFMDLYSKVDAKVESPAANTAPGQHRDEEVPF